MATQKAIEAMLEFDPAKPSKSFKQLLAENPQQLGGLAQLASAERQALSRSGDVPPKPSQPDTMTTKR